MITAAALGPCPSTTTKLGGRPVYFMISATTSLPVPPPLDRSGGEKATGLPSYEQACSVAASSAVSCARLGLPVLLLDVVDEAFCASAGAAQASPSSSAMLARATGCRPGCRRGVDRRWVVMRMLAFHAAGGRG